MYIIYVYMLHGGRSTAGNSIEGSTNGVAPLMGTVLGPVVLAEPGAVVLGAMGGSCVGGEPDY